ncbi:hypothetical protein Smic_22430 [Streptomyces microflavus]|uniref:Uncharacterized protein n=1 Tax=Streptomyces microflavus TaxID=1919 RepID=A0A7J0CPQ2_STRMI|nr:hypothetical protein Smic_22430 [Streptomyces microflavus]
MPETTIPNTPTFVLVGHGMVGQRFLESLAARGLTPAAGRARVVVLCEEPRPAYDRVQLTSYFAGRSPRNSRWWSRSSWRSTASSCTSATRRGASTARPGR